MNKYLDKPVALVKKDFQLTKDLEKIAQFLKDFKPEENIPTGWICPKCGAVHAPHINTCNCYLQTRYYPPYYPTPYYPPIVWC